ncbi:unnamed protein product [Linum tenue]|uniref:Cucumisin n=2 Tax=Linum tenue TaxID=586396 RepID=A0AAV0JMD2_9ROSI|nr:unnamed protein product [Linum tenue]
MSAIMRATSDRLHRAAALIAAAGFMLLIGCCCAGDRAQEKESKDCNSLNGFGFKFVWSSWARNPKKIGPFANSHRLHLQVYIVYMGDRPRPGIAGTAAASALHISLLHQVTGSATAASESLVCSYSRSFNGFAARLTKTESEKLSGYEGVVSVFASQKRELHTTRSWDFLGFHQNVKRRTVESDIIIGMLDTGIWPESQSFNDSGYGPPPQKWKGICQSSANFSCNNKIIGAKWYHARRNYSEHDVLSPRDSLGHGTHTASTAAGNLVTPASLFGLASGTARGGVPSARLAVYKICWSDGCFDEDTLRAFDDAIADGVDIISISVGGLFPKDYFHDPIAIGAFHSMKNGILTSNSAGNSGPSPGTLSNFSPWSLSVAASTIDRKFVTAVMLGDGRTYEGVSINTYSPRRFYPLVYGGDAGNNKSGKIATDARYCALGSLNKTLVRGKIVHCDAIGWGTLTAGAAGAIMGSSLVEDQASSFPLPVSILTDAEGATIVEYIKSTSDPIAQIFMTQDYMDNSSAYVISFSSRGPNPITRNILKPDLTAPGVNILAAWSPAAALTNLPGDTRIAPFNVISGTSMACPHATAAAAYVKSFHPTWSPAAIKSALMTTAHPIRVKVLPDAEFGYGSGQVDPLKAVVPGLVYDAGLSDYVKFLCGQGYTNAQLREITGDQSSCSSAATNETVWNLNYPSFILSTEKPRTSVTRVFHRIVTNVGSATSTYKAIAKTPVGLMIQVEPPVFSFNNTGEKRSFVVTVTARLGRTMLSGSLVLSDGTHSVRSPVVAFVASQERN